MGSFPRSVRRSARSTRVERELRARFRLYSEPGGGQHRSGRLTQQLPTGYILFLWPKLS